MVCKPFPCGCCEPCGDYYDPNEWYAILCNVQHSEFNSWANRTGTGTSRYWSDFNNLATDINGLMLNWQFAGTEPSSVIGDTRIYKSPLIDLSTILDRTLVLKEGPQFSADIDYVPINIVFTNFEGQIIITDDCGTFRADVYLYADMTYDGAPRSAVRTKYEDYVLRTSAGTSSAFNIPCGTIAENLGIDSRNATYDDFPIPVSPRPLAIDGSGTVLYSRVAANNSTLDCTE